jgi:trans-aconitate 2-methyltransferase
MADWNAERYHEISSPQQTWGRSVLQRLPLAGDERVLDLGCGTGRLTGDLYNAVPRGRVVGADRSSTMLDAAARWLREHGPGVRLVQADAARLPFWRAFDAIFSTATFHWVLDHGALFRSVIAALRPGGRLVAQCGGAGNLSLLRARADGLMRDPRFANFFDDWQEPWYYADVQSTERRLAAAGFVDIDVTLVAAPTTFPGHAEYEDFVATVCVRNHVARLPSVERKIFLRELTLQAAADEPPFTLDYWRLNIDASRPA